MWMVVYFWRLLNPHMITQYILVAILYNKLFEYITSVQFLGFLPLTLLGIVSHVYAKYVLSCIAAAATTAAL